jgi:hypothetical protein
MFLAVIGGSKWALKQDAQYSEIRFQRQPKRNRAQPAIPAIRPGRGFLGGRGWNSKAGKQPTFS